MGVAVRDDAFREREADACDARQEPRARGVELDADAVDAAFHHVIELLAESGLRYVVLILADADAFRIDLHELGQRVLQATRDADRAADREVELGKLLASDVARR